MLLNLKNLGLVYLLLFGLVGCKPRTEHDLPRKESDENDISKHDDEDAALKRLELEKKHEQEIRDINARVLAELESVKREREEADAKRESDRIAQELAAQELVERERKEEAEKRQKKYQEKSKIEKQEFLDSIKPEERIINADLEISTTPIKIGQGARGHVFQAKYQGKDVAIKVSGGSGSDKDLLAEARRLGKLNSPFVPKYYGLWVDGDGIGMVMEKGREALDESIEAGKKIPNAVLLQAIKDMIKLKEELDSKKITYSDIKPANLLIMDDDTIKAIDINYGETLQYVGSYGQKMAHALLEAKLGAQITPKFSGYRSSVAFNKYVAKIIYKKATGNNDTNAINSLADLFHALDLPNKSEEEREKVFFYSQYNDWIKIDLDKLKKPNAKMPESCALEDAFIDFNYGSEKMSKIERMKEVFYEALEDIFSDDPETELKEALKNLHDLY